MNRSITLAVFAILVGASQIASSTPSYAYNLRFAGPQLQLLYQGLQGAQYLQRFQTPQGRQRVYDIRMNAYRNWNGYGIIRLQRPRY